MEHAPHDQAGPPVARIERKQLSFDGHARHTRHFIKRDKHVIRNRLQFPHYMLHKLTQ